MNRTLFTINIANFLLRLVAEGEHPVGESWWREDVEQHALWQLGRDSEGVVVDKSKVVTECDGYKSLSNHQSGRAVDIQFLNDEGTEVTDPKKGWTYWHNVWERDFQGKPIIPWDEDHFEA